MDEPSVPASDDATGLAADAAPTPDDATDDEPDPTDEPGSVDPGTDDPDGTDVDASGADETAAPDELDASAVGDDATLTPSRDAGDSSDDLGPTGPEGLDASSNQADASERPDAGGASGRDAGDGGGRPPVVLTLPQLLEAYEAEDITLAELTQAVSKLAGAAADVLEQTWTGPIVVAEGTYRPWSILVPEGSALVLAPGAHINFQEGADLEVLGQLYVLGTADNPAVIDGQGGGFEAIYLRGGRSEFHNCTLAGGSALLRIEGTAEELIEVDACALDEWGDTEAAAIVADGANNLWVHDSTFAVNTNEAAIVGQAIMATNSLMAVERNRFAYWPTLDDSISLSSCQEGQRSRVTFNEFAGGGDDAIDCDGCDIVIDANTIRDFTRTSSGCITLGDDTNGLVTNNLFENCYSAFDLSGVAQALVVNNTVVSSLTGVFSENEARLRLVGNIFWANDFDLDLQSNVDAEIRNNIIDAAEASDDSNFLEDPQFMGSAEVLYLLGAGSPALDHEYADAEALVQGMAFPVHEVENALEHDQRGESRQVPVLDYGAFERP